MDANMERIQTFNHEGKEIVYFDLTNISNNEEFAPVIEAAKETISRYEHNSVYTMTNITNITFDTKTKELAADWMSFNKPYVIFGAFIGVDGIKKIMMTAVFKISGRTKVKIFSSKDKALEWIAEQ